MSELYTEGDSIKGKIIAYQAGKRYGEKVIQRSSGHKGVGGKLRTAYCVIERKLEFVPNDRKD